MKRVLLVTHMYSHNSGDLLISESIYADAASKPGWQVERLPFLYYNGMKGSKWLNGLVGLGRVYKAVRRNDVVVMAGGNLVIPRVARFAASFFVYCLIASLLRRNVYTAFMGASSRSSWIGGKLYASGLRMTRINWARDGHSVDVINRMANRNDTRMSPDGAFFCTRECPSDAEKGNRLAIVPFAHEELFWNERLTSISLQAYEAQYQDMIGELKNQGWDVRIIVTSEVDRLFGEKLAHSHDLQLFQPEDGVALLETVCDSCDVLVSTRMHGLIAGMLAGKAVIPVAGQHKVKALFRMISPEVEVPVQRVDEGLKDRIITLLRDGKGFVLSSETRARLLDELHAVWDAIDQDLAGAGIE